MEMENLKQEIRQYKEDAEKNLPVLRNARVKQKLFIENKKWIIRNWLM